MVAEFVEQPRESAGAVVSEGPHLHEVVVHDPHWHGKSIFETLAQVVGLDPVRTRRAVGQLVTAKLLKKERKSGSKSPIPSIRLVG